TADFGELEMNSTNSTCRELAAPGAPRMGALSKLLRDQVWSRLFVILAALTVPGVTLAQTDLKKPTAIQTEDVPSIPADFAALLLQYQNTRAASFAGWSPDGKGILIDTRFANSRQLHRVYEPGGRREQITFFDEPTNGEFVPKAADGAIL